MTPEQKLSALFAAEAPPARDYAFQAAVAQGIARRRAWMTVAALIPWAIAAVALLWGLNPIVAPLAQGLEATIQPSALVLAGASAAVVAALWLSRRFRSA